MNKSGHLPLCVLLLAFHGVLCSEFTDTQNALSKFKFHDEISSGNFKSFWRNSKQRRSVKSVGDGQKTITDQTLTKKPQFECGDRVLTVLLKHVDAINIRLYGPHGDQLHLDHLAAFCGVSVKTTDTDIRLLFNYDSCYVKQKAAEYVLSLSWYGTDIDLSCPVSMTPPSIICKKEAIELTVVVGTADKVSVALNGEWAPLFYVASQCWRQELSNQGAHTFSIPYTSCGVTVGDGQFDLELRLRNKMITLSCPYEPIPVLPVKHTGLSVTNQPLPQRKPDLYHKPPTRFPTKTIDSQVMADQAFQLHHAATSPSLHRRSPSLPKLPSLPGSFNLAVNFPFSIPVPTRHAHRDYLTSEPEPLTPAPTFDLTPDPTDSSSSVEDPQLDVSSEQTQEEPAAPVTETPNSEYYMQYPYKFEKPAPISYQIEPSPASEYQLSRGPVSSAAMYQPYGSFQNFPKPNPLQVNPAFASLAQYIPPGYFLCSYNNQQPPIDPQMFQPPVSNQPLQYQKPSSQKPDIAQFAPVNSVVPPMKGYSEQVLQTSAVASRRHDSGSPLFQPSQHFQPSQYQQYHYQHGYGHQGSTTPLSPNAPLIPTNPQTQTRPHSTFQGSRPLQPQYYQKPSQPQGPVQQPWSTNPFLVKGFTQESRPFMSASSQTPVYQTYGDQSLDVYQRSIALAPGTGISSDPQYLPSQFPTFSYQPEKLSADVFTEQTRSSPKGFFQPRSKSSEPRSKTQVAKPPYRQGPSVRYVQNPHVHPEMPSKPSKPSQQMPQNVKQPPYKFFRRLSIPKDVHGPPHFRSASQE